MRETDVISSLILSQRQRESSGKDDSGDEAIDPALRNSTMSVNVRMRYDSPPPPPPPPPSMATLPHSPAPSSDASQERSSLGTPPVRRSPHSYPPPYPHPHYLQQQQHQHQHQQQQQQQQYHHHHHRYDHPYLYPSNQFSIPTMHPQHHHRTDPYHPYPGPQPVTIVHTDDAATKLSDRVRRRCFNCCTTDTSTWRRSNLSPGKVVNWFPFWLFLSLSHTHTSSLHSSATSVVSLNVLTHVPVLSSFLTNGVLLPLLLSAAALPPTISLPLLLLLPVLLPTTPPLQGTLLFTLGLILLLLLLLLPLLTLPGKTPPPTPVIPTAGTLPLPLLLLLVQIHSPPPPPPPPPLPLPQRMPRLKWPCMS